MRKAIIVISGNSEGKTVFERIAKRSFYVWNLNARNYLTNIAKERLFWNGERDEQYYYFLSEFFALANKYFSFEEKYIVERIQKFSGDPAEVKEVVSETGERQTFEKFILVIHGLSKALVEEMRETYGAIEIFVTSRKFNSSNEGEHDLVLYDDDPDYEERVLKVLNTITNSSETEKES